MVIHVVGYIYIYIHAYVTKTLTHRSKIDESVSSSNLISQISFSRLSHFNEETIRKNFGSSANDGEEKNNKREKHPETKIIMKTEDYNIYYRSTRSTEGQYYKFGCSSIYLESRDTY